jgi:hypothetical protein
MSGIARLIYSEFLCDFLQRGLLQEMALAETRDRRSNDVNSMSKILDEEEEDDFYKTTYGGFTEIEDDDDYQ